MPFKLPRFFPFSTFTMSRFVITGGTGGAPNRLEINDLIKDQYQFSLYIQALSKLSLSLSFNLSVH